jgi:hypothetical protein
MRKLTMVVALATIFALVVAGPALAQTVVLTAGNDFYGEQFCPPDGDEEVFARAGDDRLRLDPCGDPNTPDSPEDGFPDTPDTDSDADVANGQAGNDFIRVDDGDIQDTARGGPGTDQCRGDLDVGASAASVDDPPIGPGGGTGPEEDIGDTLNCEQKTWIKGFTFYTQS